MLRGLWCMLVVVVWTGVIFPLTVLTLLVTGSPAKVMWWIQKGWSPVLLWAAGAKLCVHGQEHLLPNTPAMFLANHMSTLDIPALFAALPQNARFIAKHQLQYVPVIGWFLWMADFVFINRSNRAQAAKSLDRAAAQLRRGVSMMVFAEGTRSGTGFILPFKKGPFYLALDVRVPVYPVAIVGSDRVMPKNSWNIRPGAVHVAIGKPILPADFPADKDELLQRVRSQVVELHLQHGGKGGAPDGLAGSQRSHLV